METYQKILVPLDGSKLSESVLPEAEKLATISKAEICLIRVAYSPVNMLRTEPFARQAEITREAEQYLKNIKKHLEAKGLTVESWVWYGPNAAKEILNHIEFFGTDLIVMATHGRSGLRHLLMGSVAESVVRNTTKPVILVRPQPEAIDKFAEIGAYAHIAN